MTHGSASLQPQQSRQCAASAFAHASASVSEWNWSAFCGSGWPADRRRGPIKSFRHQLVPFCIRNSSKYFSNAYEVTPGLLWPVVIGAAPAARIHPSPCDLTIASTCRGRNKNQFSYCCALVIDTKMNERARVVRVLGDVPIANEILGFRTKANSHCAAWSPRSAGAISRDGDAIATSLGASPSLAHLDSPSTEIPAKSRLVAPTASSTRRRKVWGNRLSNSSRRREYEVRRVQSSVHRISEQECAERVSAAIIEFPAKDLQRITDKTIDATKSWKAGRRCPHLASVINLARQLPAVKKWLISEIERGEASDFENDPRTMDAVYRALQKLPPDVVRALVRRAGPHD